MGDGQQEPGSSRAPKKPPTFTVWADTREKQIPPFPIGVTVERHMMAEGDYSCPELIDVARIERKSGGDFASTMAWGRERFDREIERLKAFRWRCIVVEADFSMVMREAPGVHPHSLIGSVAALYARHDCPTFFSVNPTAAGRLIVGVLRRWVQRIEAERAGA